MTRILNGIDLDSLVEGGYTEYPDIYPGRTVHIDADFLAYMVSADDSKSIDDMKHNAKEKIEHIRRMAGAQYTELHLTPSSSNKGGRYDIALLKEYQAARKDKIKPKYLAVIRNWMAEDLGARMHYDCEADDGMSMMQYAALGSDPLKSIIASKDKDLSMVPGLQLDWDTGEISDTGDDPFGTIWVDDSKKTKKVKGRGFKFFWAQMLMGDPADNISGLPLVCDEKYLTGKPKKVGPMMAFEILDPVKTNKEAFQVVRDLYRAYEEFDKESPRFVNYRNGQPVPWGEAFLSEAKLLWMRRHNKETDVMDWMKETCL